MIATKPDPVRLESKRTEFYLLIQFTTVIATKL